MKDIIRAVIVFPLISLLLAGEATAKKYAVIVGVADYPNANPLVGPVEDANNMHRFLVKSMGYEESGIKVLTDSKATRSNILQTTQNWLVESTQAGDEVLFYFSGHGFQVEDKNNEETDNKDEAIAPYNVAVNENNEFVNMITDDEIGDLLARMTDRKATVIIDSCHSGSLTRGLFGNAGNQYVKSLQSLQRTRSISDATITAHRKEESFIKGNENLAVWSAVSSWQKALVDFETGNGSVFTNLYIEGVRDQKADRNKDLVISRSELLDFVRDGSQAFCNRNAEFCKTGMTPTLETTKDLFVEDISGEGVSVTNVSTAEYFDQVLTPDSEVVTVKILPGERVRSGQNIQVVVNSREGGYLMIFDVRDDGKVVQLFPTTMASEAHRSGKIAMNRAMKIPDKGYAFRYEAFDPGSSGQIYAIVSEDKLPENVTPQRGLIVEDPKQYVNDIATTLYQVWSEDLINRQINWSVGKAGYVVVTK